MTEKDYLNLLSGTDVRGVAIATEKSAVTLTDEAVTNVVKAFCVWAEKRLHRTPTVAVGHDSRLSSEHIASLAEEAIKSVGANAIVTGLSSTPSMFMLLKDGFGADVSIMITASHLPFEMNGLKFFTEEGGLESGDVKELLTIAAAGNFPQGGGTSTKKSYLKKYAGDLVKLVQKATKEAAPLTGLKIIVDAGNGAGGFYVDEVLKPLGADTEGSQFLEPDGRFPNHIPNPENAEAMHALSEAVKRGNADFGIIFDTDVDRAGAVAPNGEEINRNRLIALISAILLQEKSGATIVTDSVTSDGLTKFIEAKGGSHHRFKRGYKNVINESKRLNEQGIYSPLAIETSGHAALKENYFLDDGAYLVTRLLIALAKCNKEGGTLTDLIADLPEAKEATEVRLRFKQGVDFKTLGKTVMSEWREYALAKGYISPVANDYEGVRLNFDKEHGDGWLLVRMSLHEPIMPVNAESDEVGGTKKIFKELYSFLARYDFLELDNLEKLTL